MEIKTRKTEWKLNQEKQEKIETINMSFKRLIFPFQYLAEKKENILSRLFNLKILIYQHNISIYKYIPGLPLVKKNQPIGAQHYVE